MVYWMILLFPIIGNQWHDFWTMSSLLRLSLAMSPLSCPAAPGGCFAFLSPPPTPIPAGWGLVQGLSPEMRVGQGLGPEALGPSGSGYILTTLTLGTSQSVNWHLAKGVWTWKLSLVLRQTLQRFLSEKLMAWEGHELAECWDGLDRLVLLGPQ